MLKYFLFLVYSFATVKKTKLVTMSDILGYNYVFKTRFSQNFKQNQYLSGTYRIMFLSRLSASNGHMGLGVLL